MVGMVGKDQPQDQAGATTSPWGPQSQSGTARPSGHMPLKPPVPLLLPQLAVPGPGEQRGLCHLWLHISMALREDKPFAIIFPTKTEKNSEN